MRVYYWGSAMSRMAMAMFCHVTSHIRHKTCSWWVLHHFTRFFHCIKHSISYITSPSFLLLTVSLGWYRSRMLSRMAMAMFCHVTSHIRHKTCSWWVLHHFTRFFHCIKHSISYITSPSFLLLTVSLGWYRSRMLSFLLLTGSLETILFHLHKY